MARFQFYADVALYLAVLVFLTIITVSYHREIRKYAVPLSHKSLC